MKHMGWTAALIAAAGVVVLLLLGPGIQGQQVLQDGFEGREVRWQKGPADAGFKEIAHRLTNADESAHGGRRSELIELDAQAGSYIHYTYDIGKAPVADELNVSLWVKANRPGVQLLCRVVLPRERDPHNLDQPMTALLRADDYQNAGRWQQLLLRQPTKRLREQIQLLRADLKRDVIAADAYIDQLVLNVWSGPGQTSVWTDDLEVSPVLETKTAPPPTDPPTGRVDATPTGRPPAPRRTDAVQLEGMTLIVDGKPFFPRIIKHSGTPQKTLYDAGFNVIALDETSPPGMIEEAARIGFKIMPIVAAPPPDPPGGRVEGQLTSHEVFGRKLGRFLDAGSVLCWDLGDSLSAEQFKPVARSAQMFHAADPMRPVSADVTDGCLAYSRGLDQVMVGVHRWPLLTTMELTWYRDWLTQRRQLAQPGAFCWTWVQTHLPDWFLAQAYEREGSGGAFTEPLGPQPEQIRLLAYTAVGCGYRGLGFWSDRFLADTHTGRDRLLSLAMLNQELEMLEPLLVEGREPSWIDTSRPEVKAAVIRTGKAVLVLPMWIGAGSQFVPGQAAAATLSIDVPMIPPSWGAWEVSPGEVRSVQPKRVVGAVRVELHNFSLTSAVVFTSDLSGTVVWFQNQQRKMAPMAAQWAHDQAVEELGKVEYVNQELVKLGHELPDGAELLKSARAALDRSGEARRDGNHEGAYAEAQTALRALRVLMRAHWDVARKPLDSPTSSPFAVSFYTLPKHWRLVDEMSHLQTAANVLPDGDFETPPERVPQGWLVQEAPSLDAVTATARRVTKDPHTGGQCLMLKLAPKDPTLPPLALERTFLAIHSPAVHLAPGTLVRISAWVRMPGGIGASPDGALLYDSAGGEPLAIRLTEPSAAWKQFTMYRRVPPNGAVNVTLALTGLGEVYFDDVRIEPLAPKDTPTTSVARPASPGS